VSTASELPPDYELVLRPAAVISLRDLREVWRYRELLWTLAARDVRVRYKQAAFGVAWAVIQPLIQMVVYTVLFNRLAHIQSDSAVPYALFTFSGTVIWSLFSSGLNQASSSLVDNANVIKKVYFPRIVIPLAAILVAAVDFAIGFVLVLAAVPLLGGTFHLTMLAAPLFALLAALSAFSLGVWLSAINIQFRDVRYALPFFLQLMIFATPVFYPSSMIPASYRFVLYANPMAAIVDGFRAAMFDTEMPWDRLGIAVGMTLVLATTGFLYFRRMERTFADRA
jgi:lipopolysaccharide transport system permease protein